MAGHCSFRRDSRINIASTLWVFFHHRRFLAPKFEYLDFHSMRTLSQAGWQFFLIGIMALVTFQTDNLVIGHYLGAGKVPEYSLTYNLFAYTSLPQNMLFSYLWAAYTEAIARKDIAWVARTFRLTYHWPPVYSCERRDSIDYCETIYPPMDPRRDHSVGRAGRMDGRMERD